MCRQGALGRELLVGVVVAGGVAPLGAPSATRTTSVISVPRRVMLGAHATTGVVDRVLLTGGAVLHRRGEMAAR